MSFFKQLVDRWKHGDPEQNRAVDLQNENQRLLSLYISREQEGAGREELDDYHRQAQVVMEELDSIIGRHVRRA